MIIEHNYCKYKNAFTSFLPKTDITCVLPLNSLQRYAIKPKLYSNILSLYIKGDTLHSLKKICILSENVIFHE